MPSDKRCLRIGVIGCGRRGPEHIRVFNELDRSEVSACADRRQSQLDRVSRDAPHIRTTTDYRYLLESDALDAVVIATPAGTHARLAKEALEAGKHVLVETPMCTTRREAGDLSALADAKGLALMAGHVFLFDDGITRLREIVACGEFGRVHYLDAARTNPGPVRADASVLYELGTHDISVCNYLLDATPVEVSACGSCIHSEGIEDVCFVTLKYPDGTLAHIHVSWLNPRTVRTLTVVGENWTGHWDDVDSAHTLRLYKKGLDESSHRDSSGRSVSALRSGVVDVSVARQTEPLANQAKAFVDRVLTDVPYRSGAEEGLDVAKVLEAATRSMSIGGAMCPVEVTPPVISKTAWASVETLGKPRPVEVAPLELAPVETTRSEVAGVVSAGE